MKPDKREQSECPCKECQECSSGFQKVVDLKNAGLVIYRHTMHTEDVNTNTGLVEFATKVTDEVFILHNTKDTEITPADYMSEIDQHNINCPRCRRILEHAQKLLEKVPTIDKNYVKGICEHCRKKDTACFECEEIVKKFLANTNRRESNKERVRLWLAKIKRLLKDALVETNETGKGRIRAQSELYIDQLCRDAPKADHEPDVKQMFDLESQISDFYGVFPPSIEKRKKMFAHFPQLDKHDRPVVFLDSEGNLDKHAILSDSESADLRSTFYSPVTGKDIEKLKNETYIKLRAPVPPVPYQSEDDFIHGRDENVQNTYSQRPLIRPKSRYASDDHPESEIERFIEVSTRGQERRIHEASRPSKPENDYWRSTRLPQHSKKEIRSQTVESTRESHDKIVLSPQLIRNYHSEDTLLASMAGGAKLLQQDFSYVFPKEVSADKIKLKRPKSSSELIKDTQDMLFTKAEEEKKKLEEDRKIKLEDEERKRLAKEQRRNQLEEKRKADDEKKHMETLEKAESDKKLKHDTKIEEAKNAMEKQSSSKKDDTEKKAEKEKPAQSVSNSTSKSKIKKSRPIADKKETKLKAELKGPVEPKEPKNMKDPKDKKEPKEPKQPYETKEPKVDKEALKEAEKSRKEQEKKDKEGKLKKEKEEKEKLKKNKEVTKEKDLKQKEKDVKQQDKEDLFQEKGRDDNYKLKTKAKEEALSKQKDQETQKKLKKDKEEQVTKEKELKKKEIDVKQQEKEDLFREKGRDDNYKQKTKAKEEASSKQKDQETSKQKDKERPEIEAADKKAREEATLRLKNAKDEDNAKPEPEKPKIPQKIEEPNTKDLNIKQIKVRRQSPDDLILRLVKLKQSGGDRIRPKRLSEIMLSPKEVKAHRNCHKNNKAGACTMCLDSDLELDAESIYLKKKKVETADIIIGQKVFKYKPPLIEKRVEQAVVPLLFQSAFDEANLPVEMKEVAAISPVQPEKKNLALVSGKQTKNVEQEIPKGVIRYALSDRSFIDKGWTMLPTEKVVRKMNVYRMRPAHPEFDWFEHNKNKRLMQYDSGEKLAEFDDNGRGRWFYRNGRLALDYYDAEELNAQQRFVIYSSGEPDERGRARPYTLLATFDYLGNGIVFDHSGKIRLKYNQTEGVVLDRSIGPVSHWKWHTLNDPPVLQQVMIDTQMAHKDLGIMKLGGAHDDKTRADNEDMLAIEFDNFIKEKSKKLSQSFKPFQIKMKALKINEHFSLKVLDQATVYLIFRDGTTNLKLNIGMVLDHKEIVDTDTAEVGEVSNNMERLPARTDSLAGLQKSVAHAQRYERSRAEYERRLRLPEPCGSADKLTVAASRPLRPPLRTVPSGSTTTASAFCKCRKPTTCNVYYDNRLC